MMAMKRNTSDQLTSKEYAREALQHIRHLSEKIGPRGTGSKAEAEAAEYVRQHLLSIGLAPTLQNFRAPFSVWTPFAVASAIALLGIGLWVLTRGSTLGAYLGAIGCGFALWEVYAELNFGWTPLTGLTPQVDSRNVIVSFPPTEQQGRHVVFFAHLDTQRTPIFMRNKAFLIGFFVLFYVAVAVLVLTTFAFVASWFGEWRLPSWAVMPGAAISLAVIGLMVQADLSPHSPGANDNASSVGVALALARHFAAHPLSNTHVWLVFTGAEETGCRGADVFLEQYGHDLFQAYVIPLEGLGVHAPAYSTREGMLRRYTSNAELLRIMRQISDERPDLGLRPVKIKGGYTEAVLAAKRGYRTMALIGLDSQGLLPYWHVPQDTAANIDPDALTRGIEAVAAIPKRLDRLPVSVQLSKLKPLSERS